MWRKVNKKSRNEHTGVECVHGKWQGNIVNNENFFSSWQNSSWCFSALVFGNENWSVSIEEDTGRQLNRAARSQVCTVNLFANELFWGLSSASDMNDVQPVCLWPNWRFDTGSGNLQPEPIMQQKKRFEHGLSPSSSFHRGFQFSRQLWWS